MKQNHLFFPYFNQIKCKKILIKMEMDWITLSNNLMVLRYDTVDKLVLCECFWVVLASLITLVAISMSECRSY